MRVACVNQDRGIAPNRQKGATVHLRAMREAFETLGAEVLAFDESDEGELRGGLSAEWKSRPFDLVYERYALGKGVGAAFAREKDIPFVLEVNAPLLEEESVWRGTKSTPEVHRMDERVFSTATRVIAVSQLVAQYAVDQGADVDRVRVFPNGVDTERFRPRGAEHALRDVLVPPGRFALGFHGRMRPWHDLSQLVQAASLLIERGAPIHLVFVGKGEYEALVGAALPRDRWTHVEWVPHDEMADYVACFDALPLTYSLDAPCYFSPLKLPEAMACGVVPIAPRTGDLPQLIEHEVSGLLYEQGDVAALADAVGWLISHDDQRKAMAAATRVRAQEFSWLAAASFALAEAPVTNEASG